MVMNYQIAVEVLRRYRRIKEPNKYEVKKALDAFVYLYFSNMNVKDIIVQCGYTKQELIDLKLIRR
ncbi:MAG: hypothetical protein ACRC41_07965 [Sarcina sp.]